MVSLGSREIPRRAVAFVSASTLVLTAAFVGLLAILNGLAGAVGSRLPIYVLGMALVFVGSVFSLVEHDADRLTSLVGSVGIALVSFVLIVLAGEGLLYTVHNVGEVFTSTLILYFLSAALIATALGFWLLSYWRDLVTPDEDLPEVDESA